MELVQKNNSVEIAVNRSGFPVKIGTLEFWFDLRVERLGDFADLEKEAMKLANELYEKILIESMNETDEPSEIDRLEKSVFLMRKANEIQYDMLLGEGTYKKLYEEYGDANALGNTLPLVISGIYEKLELIRAEADAKRQAAKKDILQKKKQKQR